MDIYVTDGSIVACVRELLSHNLNIIIKIML